MATADAAGEAELIAGLPPRTTRGPFPSSDSRHESNPVPVMSLVSRRQFLAATAAAPFAATLTSRPAVAQSSGSPRPLRVGFVGIGMKGSAHLGNLLQMAARLGTVDVVAVCDILERQTVEAQKQAQRLGLPKPTAYSRGDRDFVRMCQSEDLDLVYTATPWRWHTPVCLAALGSGSHAATEVPAALTLEDCHTLVEAAESSGRHCTMMENVNYMQAEMAIWRMVREGLLGEVVHYEGGYLHDTRPLKAQDEHDGLWLAEHHHLRNGSLYPTHAIGPAAMYLDLGRGDRMEYLVSMSSPARGLKSYLDEHLPSDHPKRNREYANGDVNTCLIKTARGRTIIVKHDTDLPRPYSRRNLVQGTRGLVRGFPRFNISLDGERLQWDDSPDWLSRYEHPLWTRVRENGLGTFENTPHEPIMPGAMWHYDVARELKNGDFLEDYRLVEAMRDGREPDYTVYDAAAWSAIAPLSEQSVANRSAAVDFPDFTEGRWKTTPPLQIEPAT